MADSGTSPYSFYINTPDISNTIYVKADDTFGNASNVIATQVIVYQTPKKPSIFEVELVGSGNLQVTIGENDGVTPIPDYYYLNDVSYFAYIYSRGGNLYFEYTNYTNNIGNLSASNTTYEKIVSYISELTENTYVLYIVAKNSVGFSYLYALQTILVYTTPKYAPTIDSVNTISYTSGNLTISIIDLSNSNINNIYYLYSLDGGQTYGNSGVAHTGNGQYSFTVSDTGNTQIPLIANTYSLSIRAINQFGNMTSIPKNVSVYTTPIAPIIDSANTVSTSSGNLTVSIIDTFNASINSVYYVYSLDGGITYGNSGIVNNGNTRYSFTVSNTGNAQIPLIANTYTLSISASNPIGNAVSNPTNVSVYTTPLPISPDNTCALAFQTGEFTVTFYDTINTLVNQVYYLVSIDGGNTYANTGIACTGIPSQQYMYRIQTPIAMNDSFNTFIKTSNTVGNSIAIPLIPYTIPDSPVLIDVVPGSGSITIVFQAPSFYGGNAISQYEYSTDNGNHFLSMGIPPFIEILSNVMSFTTTYQSNGVDRLVNSELYPITLRAMNAKGYSANISNTIYVIPFTVPDAPTLNGAIAGNQVIDISFSAPEWDGGNAIAQYQYSIDNNKTYIDISSVILENYTNTYRIEGLENGNVYNVSVCARNFRGNSAPSNILSNIVPFGIPDAPVFWTIPQNRTIQVSFTTPNNRGREITQYKYSVDGGNIFANVVPFPTANTLSGTTAFSIYNVRNGWEYPLNVISVNSIGESAVSSRVYTTPKTVPDEPTILKMIPLNGGVDIVFSPPENIGGNTITEYTYGYVL
jgi:titin